MSQKPSQKSKPFAEPPDLRKKPQRRSGRRLPILLLILGCVIVIGGGSALLWQLVAHQSDPGVGTPGSAQNRPTSPASAKQERPLNNCSGGFPPGYNDTLRQQFAQGIHLSVTQVTNELKAGKSLTELAAEQGIASNQLFTLELHAYQVADDSMVTIGCMNQYSANLDVQRYRNAGAAQLNYDFTFLFTH